MANITYITRNELNIIADDLITSFTSDQVDWLIDYIDDSSIDTITGIRDFLRFEAEDVMREYGITQEDEEEDEEEENEEEEKENESEEEDGNDAQ